MSAPTETELRQRLEGLIQRWITVERDWTTYAEGWGRGVGVALAALEIARVTRERREELSLRKAERRERQLKSRREKGQAAYQAMIRDLRRYADKTPSTHDKWNALVGEIECVIAPDGDGLWRCRRAGHIARACGTHSQFTPDNWPYQPED